MSKQLKVIHKEILELKGLISQLIHVLAHPEVIGGDETQGDNELEHPQPFPYSLDNPVNEKNRGYIS